jgi:hypothetical protein
VPQSAEHTTGPQGIGDALVHAVFKRDFIVLPKLLNAAGLEHHHNVIGILQCFAPIGGRNDRGVDVVVTDHALHEVMHLVEPGPRQRH